MASYQMLWSKAVELEAIRRVPEIEFLIENVDQIRKVEFCSTHIFSNHQAVEDSRKRRFENG